MKKLCFLVSIVLSIFSAFNAYSEKITLPIAGLETTSPEPVNIDFEWSENWFGENPSTIYNHKLARVACALAENSYAEVLKEYPDSSFTRTLYALGVQKEDIEYHYDLDYSLPVLGNNQAAFTLASKKISVHGKETNLVFVVIRGTPTNANEWISNINVSDSTQNAEAIHEGFFHAADQIHNSLIYFLLKKGIDPDNCSFLITGHSRGAALSNLLGAKMAEEGFFNTDRIYDYTFAAPNVSTLENTNGIDYGFIWNIVNAEDVVPSVPPRRDNWKFNKYGHTLAMVNYWNVDSTEYERDYLPKVNEYYQKLLGRDFTPFRTGTFIPTFITRLLTSYCKEVGDYYKNRICLRKKIEDVFWKVFPEPKKKFMVEEDGTVNLLEDAEEDKKSEKKSNNSVMESLQSSINSATNGFVDYTTQAFIDMHACEAYLSWMLSFDENELFSDVGSSQIVIEKSYECAVFDEFGNLMARMTGGILQLKTVKTPIGAGILFGKTVIAFPSNAEYTVVLYKNSLVPTIVPTRIEHYDAAGYLSESCEKKNIYPSKFLTYKFKAGKVSLEDSEIKPEKIYGLEVYRTAKAAGLTEEQHFRVQPEINFNPTVGVGGGIHVGCRNIFGSFMIGKAISSLDDGFYIAPGVGHETNLYGHVMLNVEFFSKFVWSQDDDNDKDADPQFYFVPALRFAVLVKPFRRSEIFAAVTFDGKIGGFNEAAFESEIRRDISSPWGIDDFSVVPSVSVGIKF